MVGRALNSGNIDRRPQCRKVAGSLFSASSSDYALAHWGCQLWLPDNASADGTARKRQQSAHRKVGNGKTPHGRDGWHNRCLLPKPVAELPVNQADLCDSSAGNRGFRSIWAGSWPQSSAGTAGTCAWPVCSPRWEYTTGVLARLSNWTPRASPS